MTFLYLIDKAVFYMVSKCLKYPLFFTHEVHVSGALGFMRRRIMFCLDIGCIRFGISSKIRRRVNMQFFLNCNCNFFASKNRRWKAQIQIEVIQRHDVRDRMFFGINRALQIGSCIAQKISLNRFGLERK